ncbi:MAG: hypothetical protein ACRDP1_03605 [Nocardioidaceae bacterium]
MAGSRRLHEYDGAVHRTGQAHARDLGREKALARIEWERFGYIKSEILGSPELIVRYAERASGYAARRGWLGDWTQLVGPSSLSVAGRALLDARLHRYGVPFPSRLA